MTPQEQQMLDELLNRIAGSPTQARDPEADSMIQKSLGNRPDATYILTQMALIHEIALKQAEQQIHDLQQKLASQPPAQQRASSFLGPWGQSANPQPQQSYAPPPAQQSYAAAPQYASSAPSFLHSALTTATGVVAGEMAFSAIRSLFGGSSAGGIMPGGNSFLGNAPQSETVINNYYGDNDTSAAADANDSYDNASDSDDSGSDFSSDNSDFT